MWTTQTPYVPMILHLVRLTGGCTRFCSHGTGSKLADLSWCDHLLDQLGHVRVWNHILGTRWGSMSRVSQGVENGLGIRLLAERSRLSRYCCSLPEVSVLVGVGQNPPKDRKVRGMASSFVSTAAHLNTVTWSPAVTSRSSLPTCTPPRMSGLVLLMRTQASQSLQPIPLLSALLEWTTKESRTMFFTRHRTLPQQQCKTRQNSATV